MFGVPTDADEAGLRRLASQIRTQKVVVKLFLRHPLHAKLYLLFRPDPISPTVGYLVRSNLTFAGLSKQGELFQFQVEAEKIAAHHLNKRGGVLNPCHRARLADSDWDARRRAARCAVDRRGS